MIRFGAELYRRHQPQFLLEFLQEAARAVCEGADEVRAIGRAAILGALADGARPGWYISGEASTERALAVRRDLQSALHHFPMSA